MDMDAPAPLSKQPARSCVESGSGRRRTLNRLQKRDPWSAARTGTGPVLLFVHDRTSHDRVRAPPHFVPRSARERHGPGPRAAPDTPTGSTADGLQRRRACACAHPVATKAVVEMPPAARCAVAVAVQSL